MLAEGLREVVGNRSEVYRDMVRAFESEEMVDMMLAQSSFDSLTLEVRRQIADKVDDLVKKFEEQG